MPSLTPEQREAVDQAIGREGYARIDDYVVLKAEVYTRLRAALDDGLGMAQVGSHALAKTVRRRFLTLPGRITRSGRRRWLHLPRDWPWAAGFLSALARLRTLTLTT